MVESCFWPFVHNDLFEENKGFARNLRGFLSNMVMQIHTEREVVERCFLLLHPASMSIVVLRACGKQQICAQFARFVFQIWLCRKGGRRAPTGMHVTVVMSIVVLWARGRAKDLRPVARFSFKDSHAEREAVEP